MQQQSVYDKKYQHFYENYIEEKTVERNKLYR
jgi:hypothetical protein